MKGLAVAFRDTYKRHAIQDIAAGVTFWTVLSIVPAALAVTAVLGWFEVLIGKQAADDVRAEIVEFVERTLGAAGGEIGTTIIDILTEPSSGVAIVGFLLAVWSMSKGFASLFRGLARIHGDPEARNNLVGRLLGLAFGVATVLVVLVLLLSLVAGPLLGFEKLLPNDGGLVVDLWSVVRWPVLTAGIVAWIALLLSRGPGTGLRWRQALPGAALGDPRVGADHRRLRHLPAALQRRQPAVPLARQRHRGPLLALPADHRPADRGRAERGTPRAGATPAPAPAAEGDPG